MQSERKIHADINQARDGWIQITLSGEGAADLTEAQIEAALSAAEPVGWQWRHPRWTGGQWHHCPDGLKEDKLPDTEYRPVYAVPPAPSVAVKALEWKRNGWVEAFSQPDGLGVWYSISPRKPVHGPGEAPFSCRVIWGVPNQTEGRYLGEDFQSVEEAKAAAQADYEARIRSALSAQVQDEAGWKPIETAPKDGTLILLIGGAYHGAPFPGLWEFRRFNPGRPWLSVVNGSRLYEHVPTHWMPLPAAPARQEGGHD